MHALVSLIDVAVNVLMILIVVRVVLTWFPRIDERAPWALAIARIVDPILAPFRIITPTFGLLDVSPVVAIIVLRAVDRGLSLYLNGLFASPLAVLVSIVEQVLVTVVLIMAVVVFLRLVISFLQADPFHPAVRLIRDMSRPLVQPFGAVVPRSRSFDGAALVALVAYIVAYFVIQAVLDAVIVRL